MTAQICLETHFKILAEASEISGKNIKKFSLSIHILMYEINVSKICYDYLILFYNLNNMCKSTAMFMYVCIYMEKNFGNGNLDFF